MDLGLWMGFAAASVVMGLIPGPGVMSIVGYAIGSGRHTALVSVAGMAVGNAIAMCLSLAGVGALLASSAVAFTILKWLGALYLIGLGFITIIRRGSAKNDYANAKPISPRIAFTSHVAIGTFHPKTIVFFVAFVPQFISTAHDYLTQAAILILTFIIVVACTDAAYAFVASSASSFLKVPKVARWSKCMSGGVLIAAGVATAIAKK